MLRKIIKQIGKFKEEINCYKYDLENIIIYKRSNWVLYNAKTKKEIFNDCYHRLNYKNENYVAIDFMELKLTFIVNLNTNKVHKFYNNNFENLSKIINITDEYILIRNMIGNNTMFDLNLNRAFIQSNDKNYWLDYKNIYRNKQKIAVLKEKHLELFGKEFKISLFNMKRNDWYFTDVNILKENDDVLIMNLIVTTAKKTVRSINYIYYKKDESLIPFVKKTDESFEGNLFFFNIDEKIYCLNSKVNYNIKDILFELDEVDIKLNKIDLETIGQNNYLIAIISNNFAGYTTGKYLSGILLEVTHQIIVNGIKDEFITARELNSFDSRKTQVTKTLVLCKNHYFIIKRNGVNFSIKTFKLNQELKNKLESLIENRSELTNTKSRDKVSKYLDDNGLDSVVYNILDSSYVLNNYLYLFINEEYARNEHTYYSRIRTVDTKGVIVSPKGKFVSDFVIDIEQDQPIRFIKKISGFMKTKKVEIKRMSFKNRLNNLQRKKSIIGQQ